MEILGALWIVFNIAEVNVIGQKSLYVQIQAATFSFADLCELYES